jgi:hypothetical protein
MLKDENIGLICFKGRPRKNIGLIPCEYAYGCLFLERVFDYKITSLLDDQERTIIHYLNNKKVLSSGLIILRNIVNLKGGLSSIYNDREKE